MSLKIKEWALEDRPREKLIHQGVSVLSDAELLGILIRTGTKNKSAVDLGRELLNKVDNNLNALGKLSVHDIKQISGIGEATAVTVIAALELGRRRKLSDAPVNPQIKSSRDVFELLSPLLSDLPYEEFWILYLNRANKVISRKNLSKGGISSTIIDIRIILKDAVNLLASGMILCHNHPSENMNPSDADKSITQKVKSLCLLMDINLMDHVIISGNHYYSFADNGDL